MGINEINVTSTTLNPKEITVSDTDYVFYLALMDLSDAIRQLTGVMLRK